MTLVEAIPSVLIANRGEIASRIIKTLRRLNIRSLAVFHDVDRGAPFVLEADMSYELHGDTPSGAYLDIAQIVDVGRQHHVAAIHPGYGFLAENYHFAAAVRDAGLLFVGPTPEVIRLMGDKVASRTFVAEHGFPLAPSVTSDDDLDALQREARAIGFPLLIKAAAGGGGKGMHVVRSDAAFAEAYSLARSEAERYFADARVYCEKYIERPRHIEVQVLGDEQGNCVHLGERECSVQRRFQKIIEETPAPGIEPELRHELCATAVAIASAAKYTNAGTVEFIVDESGEFYFLEMNTRLQVEHPVTEMTTGLDLVEAQLRVATGQALGFAQKDVRQSGHAIELRICAENPENDFLPATGRIRLLREPRGEGVRVDSGLVEGMDVSSAFDPMLAKLIIHATDREGAIEKAVRALSEQAILGVTTNSSFLSRVLSHPAFAAGKIHTHFIEQYRATLQRPEPSARLERAVLAMAALNDSEFTRQLSETPEPYRSMGAWRNNR